MGGGSTSHWRRLERWSPQLFLAAGVVLVGYASLNGLWAVAGVATPDSGVQLGYVLGFLGLLGLYPALAERRPWLARAGGTAAVAGIVGIVGISAVELAHLAGLAAGTPEAWPPFVALALGGFTVGYLAVGSGVLTSGLFPRPVGLVLLVPGVIVVLMVAHIVAGYASDVTAFVISAGEALAHLAIGASLRDATGERADAARPADRERGDREVAANE